MKRLLVVDDDIRIQRLLREELEEDGYHVSIASNGIEAISVLMNVSERPDLVILDLRIPRMSGLDILSHTLKLKFELPVVIYTAYGSYRNDPWAKAAHAYVVKSSDISELKKKIRELL
jgi:two-component system, response regulator, stage 0 sporulation protein F